MVLSHCFCGAQIGGQHHQKTAGTRELGDEPTKSDAFQVRYEKNIEENGRSDFLFFFFWIAMVILLCFDYFSQGLHLLSYGY